MIKPLFYRRSRIPGSITGLKNFSTIGIDGISTKIVISDITTLSWNHTVTISERLYVFVAANTNSNFSASYNSVSMERLINKSRPGGTVGIFKLDAPSVGENSVAVSGIDFGYGFAYAVSLLNLSSDIPEFAFINDGSGTSPSVNTIGLGNTMLLDIMIGQGGGGSVTLTPDASQTQILNSGDPSWRFCGGSYKKVSKSLNSMDWTLSGSFNWAIASIAVFASEF